MNGGDERNVAALHFHGHCFKVAFLSDEIEEVKQRALGEQTTSIETHLLS